MADGRGSGLPPRKLQSASLSAMSTEAPIFRGYKPLNTDRKEIRLLKISSDLDCTVRNVSLTDKVDYHALSYCWGAPGKEFTITVNGFSYARRCIVFLRSFSDAQYLNQILARPYFTRSWVVQECVVNDTVNLVRGEFVVGWDALATTLPLLEAGAQEGPFVSRDGYERKLPDQLRGWHDIEGTRQAWRQGSPVPCENIYNLVRHFRDWMCSDPKDKVYAFRALAADVDRIGVDYALPALGVVFQVLSAISGSSRTCEVSQTVNSLLFSMALDEQQVLEGLHPDRTNILLETFNTDHAYYDPFGRPAQPRSWPSVSDRLNSTWTIVAWPDQPSAGRLPIFLESQLAFGSHTIRTDLSMPLDLYLIDVSEHASAVDAINRQETEGVLSGQSMMAPDLSIEEAAESNAPEYAPPANPMGAMEQLCRGRVRPCRQLCQKFESDPDGGYWIPVHVSRVVVMALVAIRACALGQVDEVPESLVRWAAEHPPGLDDAACHCEADPGDCGNGRWKCDFKVKPDNNFQSVLGDMAAESKAKYPDDLLTTDVENGDRQLPMISEEADRKLRMLSVNLSEILKEYCEACGSQLPEAGIGRRVEFKFQG